MNRKEVIDTLKMENELMTYDPRSGEDFSPECLNDINKKCYDAHVEAIKLLKDEYGQVMEYCRSRNLRLVANEYLSVVLKGESMNLFGLPFDEARRVIEVYKYTHNIPSGDYMDGFKEGAEYMKTQYEKTLDELLKNLMGEGVLPQGKGEEKCR